MINEKAKKQNVSNDIQELMKNEAIEADDRAF
jgi:hypothetical protein